MTILRQTLLEVLSASFAARSSILGVARETITTGS